jgi:hypothetical protein
MKRCPRCSFIYEDDQRLCDLDGGELVQASGILPPPQIAPPPSSVPPMKTRRSGSLFLPLAGVVFAAVLFSVYHLMPKQAALRATEQYSPATLAATPQPTPNLTRATTPAAFIPPPAPAPSVTEVKAIKRATATTPKRPTVDSRPPLAHPEEKTTQTVVASPKKESKLGSPLKKTGRLLKKPFKF